MSRYVRCNICGRWIKWESEQSHRCDAAVLKRVEAGYKAAVTRAERRRERFPSVGERLDAGYEMLRSSGDYE